MENIEVPVSGGDDSNTVETIATIVKGTVKWFHRVRGFGFITRDDTNEDIFCHYTSIKPMAINLRRAKKRLNLMDNEKVVFDIVKNKGNLEAVNVVGKNGYYIIDIIAYKREIPPYDLAIVNDARVTGKVKWFNVKIKYGFIHCDYNDEDVFVHSSAIVKNNPDKSKPSLCEGESVEFDILKRADGKLEAVNVSGPHGSNVQGSRYSPDKSSSEYASASEGNTSTNKKYVENNLVGKVKWFNVKAGFGFINRNDNGQDVYAHHTAIIKKNPAHAVRSLADGELVQFNIVEGTKGLEAADITGINGGPVQGSEYARPLRGVPGGGGGGSGRSRGRGPEGRSRGGSSVRQPRQQRRSTRRSASGGAGVNRSTQQQAPPPVRAPLAGGRSGGGGGLRRATAGQQSSRQQQQIAPLQPPPPPLQQQQQQYTEVAPSGTYAYFNNRPNRQGGMYDSSGRMGGAAVVAANYGPSGVMSPVPPLSQQMRNNTANTQAQYSSPPYGNTRAGGYMNGGSDAPAPPPPPHSAAAFMPPPPPPQGPPMAPQQSPYDNNGAYYNQRMPPPPPPPQNNYQYQAPSNGNGILVDQRVQGFVKWYNFKNGFGFVTRNDNNQEIFVHKSGIQASNGPQPSLDDGEPVEFDVYQDGSRLLAINVTGPGGSILRGSKYATAQRMRPNNSMAAAGAPAKVYHRRKAN